MDLYEELFQISKLLLAEDDGERTPEVLLRRIIKKCGAETGFVVVREEGSFRQKFDVGYDRSRLSALERRFSRALGRKPGQACLSALAAAREIPPPSGGGGAAQERHHRIG